MLGGVILGDKEYIDGPVQTLMRHTGPALSPFNAWVLLKGLETLSVRVNYSNASAQRVAEFLRAIPAFGGCATRSCRRTRSTTWPSGR